MNDLQRKELEILRCFVEVCDKLNLTYYLVCGSALGAVKYGGFIPWDDDVDVALPRGDYETFLEKAPSMLPEHLFIQNYRTENRFPLLMTKLRDSRTTMIEEDFANFSMHHGVAIDVFPLDGYPKNAHDITAFEKKKKYFVRRQFLCMMGKRGHFFVNVRSTFLWVLYRFFGYCKNTSCLMARYDAFLASYPVEGSDVVCNHGNWQGTLEYAPSEQYGDGTMMLFEGMTVRVPAQYDAYLQQKYGNYRKDPPIEKQVSHHKYTVVDLQNPYTVYTS